MADTEYGSFGGQSIQSASQHYRQIAESDNPDPNALAQIARCNSYRCPRGAMPGEAWLLMLYSDVQVVQAISLGNDPYNALILGCGQNQLQAAKMVFLDATQIVGGAAEDPNGLFIVHAADERAIGLRSTFTQAYNVRTLADPTAEYWSETEDPAAAVLFNGNPGPGRGPWTWQKMLGSIWTYVSPAPTLVGLTFPTSNPERFRFIEQAPLSAYAECLQSLFMDLVYNPTNGGSFSAVQRGAADTNFQQLQQASQNFLLFANNPVESDDIWFPASVDVVFLAIYPGAPEESITTAPYYVFNGGPTTMPNGATPVPGTTDVIFAPLDAQMCCQNQNPTNVIALNTLAQLLINSYYQSRDQAERPKLWCYDGIQAFNPGSQVEEVVWHLGPSGATTTVAAMAGT
jgi:hypothetical protein